MPQKARIPPGKTPTKSKSKSKSSLEKSPSIEKLKAKMKQQSGGIFSFAPSGSAHTTQKKTTTEQKKRKQLSEVTPSVNSK